MNDAIREEFPRHLVLGKQYVFEGFHVDRDAIRGGRWRKITTVFRSTYEAVVCVGFMQKDQVDKAKMRKELGHAVEGHQISDVAVRMFEGTPEQFESIWNKFKRQMDVDCEFTNRFCWRRDRQ